MWKVAILIFCVSPIFCYIPKEDYGEALDRIATELHNRCALYSGTNETELEPVREGNFDAPDSVKRFVACVWVESDVIDLDFNINDELLKQLLPPQIGKKGVEDYFECLRIGKESDATDIVHKLWITLECTYKSNPEAFVLV